MKCAQEGCTDDPPRSTPDPQPDDPVARLVGGRIVRNSVVCARPGCGNTFVPSRCDHKYCGDPACRRALLNGRALDRYHKAKDKVPGEWRVRKVCARPGCGESFMPERYGQKFCKTPRCKVLTQAIRRCRGLARKIEALSGKAVADPIASHESGLARLSAQIAPAPALLARTHEDRRCHNPECTNQLPEDAGRTKHYCGAPECTRGRALQRKARYIARDPEQFPPERQRPGSARSQYAQLQMVLAATKMVNADALQEDLPGADSVRESAQAALDAARIRLIETQAVIQVLTQLLYPQEMMVVPRATDNGATQRVEVSH